jgi:hypothetical protein
MDGREKSMNALIPVYTIVLPEYQMEPETDWLSIGRKLDGLIAIRFPGKRLAFRGVGLRDHSGWTQDDLIATIVTLGTDKYDPQRSGLYYARDEISDIHAMPCVVTAEGLRAEKHKEGSPLAEFLELFYEGALADRGYPVHIDILMIYDLEQLTPVHDLPLESCYEFAFKNPLERQRALLGIIKIVS